MNGDQSQAPCLALASVDRASGATDIYGKAIEAGYPLEEAYICAQADLYMDVYTSDDYGTQQKIACSYNDDATGCDFDSSDWEQVLRCNDSVSCPRGFCHHGTLS